MRDIIVQRLLESFSELERAITSARTALSRKGTASSDAMLRIESYERILEKQRSLFTAMCGYMELGNWAEVSRHIRLINGLSEMIRDDAREVAQLLRPSQTLEQDVFIPAEQLN